jgi:hypothetical protein
MGEGWQASQPGPGGPRAGTAAYADREVQSGSPGRYEAEKPGEKGVILCREGLYSSHIVEWRRACDARTVAALVQLLAASSRFS